MQFTVAQPVEVPASHAVVDQWTARVTGSSDIVCITGMTRKGAGFRICGTIQQLRAASEGDGDLAQQIDAL